MFSKLPIQFSDFPESHMYRARIPYVPRQLSIFTSPESQKSFNGILADFLTNISIVDLLLKMSNNYKLTILDLLHLL